MNNLERLEDCRKELVGKKFVTNQGCELEVIKYYSHKNITVRFCNGHIETNISHGAIKNGSVKNRTFPSVCKIGYEGIGKYTSKTNSLAYDRWVSMIRRCYHEDELIKRPTYREVYVCDEWLNFQNYVPWFESNYIEKFVLDKDILVKGNKTYSPETCCFVPNEINTIFVKNNSRRGDYPVGINKRCKKYKVRCHINGNNTYLGAYNTIDEAFKIYKEAKENEITRLANKWKSKITNKTFDALINYKVEITD